MRGGARARGGRGRPSGRSRSSPATSCPAKKPAPDVYLLAVEKLGLDPADTLVVEDSRNGLLAAVAAGLHCLVTVNGYTREEDFERGRAGGLRARRPGRPRRSRCSPTAAAIAPGDVTLDDLRACLRAPHGPARAGSGRRTEEGATAMTESLERTELVVRTIAQTAVDNEKYFGDLDAVVGDGDFGYSLARGFEKVLEGWDDIDRTRRRHVPQEDRHDHLLADRRHVGPDLGHRVPARRHDRGRATRSTAPKVVAMLRPPTEGIKTRGQSDVGDKTLLDALVPLTDRLEQELTGGAGRRRRRSPRRRPRAREAAEATTTLIAKRGRASLHRRAQHRLGRRRARWRSRSSPRRSARRGTEEALVT